MGLLKPHLIECPPLEMSIVVKKDAPRQRKFMSLPVMVHSETFKKALQFLVNHNYSFDELEKDNEADLQKLLNGQDKDEEEGKETLTTKLRKRQAKCDLKIAEAIEKLRRGQYQMDFYDKFSSVDGFQADSVQRHLTNTILE